MSRSRRSTSAVSRGWRRSTACSSAAASPSPRAETRLDCATCAPTQLAAPCTSSATRSPSSSTGTQPSSGAATRAWTRSSRSGQDLRLEPFLLGRGRRLHANRAHVDVGVRVPPRAVPGLVAAEPPCNTVSRRGCQRSLSRMRLPQRSQRWKRSVRKNGRLRRGSLWPRRRQRRFMARGRRARASFPRSRPRGGR